MPKLSTVARVDGIGTSEQALERLRDPTVDLREVAIVEGVESLSLAKAELKEVRFSPHRAKAQVIAKAPGTFVVFSSANYPGWSAFVDGRRQPLWSANGLGMGVVVPEGVHEVEFAFSDRMLGWGLGCSLLGAAVSLALVVGTSRRRRRGCCAS
ncbi:MAG: YfhO family protein [Myxococcales bacterium]